MDNSSVGAGFMAVFAVSGSVALLAHQIHKRVLSDFMKKFEFELVGSNKNLPKKKVRFADDVSGPTDYKMHDKKHPASLAEHGGQSFIVERVAGEREFRTMPLNRQVLYKGIIEFKGLKGQYI